LAAIRQAAPRKARMRFELVAAYVMGVALPLLEGLRRRTNFESISGYVDDFIAGGLLLYAARLVSRQAPRGPVLLVAAWAVLCGGLYGSFFGQLEHGASRDVSGLATTTVVVIKGALYAIALASLVLSVRAAIPKSQQTR
jgi:uncharacterized membrane protein YdcZ (DUF606 family)